MRSKFTNCLPLFLAFFLLITSGGLQAQAKNKTTTAPETITINKTEFDRLLGLRKGATFISGSNKYIHKARMIKNTRNGDMQFIRLKLAALPKAYLTIQVNGEASTQVFILSDDHRLSYKGELNDREVLLTKCREDEIVSE